MFVSYRYSFEELFVLIEEITLRILAGTPWGLSRHHHIFRLYRHLLWLCLLLLRGVVLSGLVGFSSHDVFDSVFHFSEVVAASVELSNADEVEGIGYQVGLDLHVEG